MACNGLKMGSYHSFRHSKCRRIVFGKINLTHVLRYFCPKTTHFQGISGFYEGQNGPLQAQKLPKNTGFGIPCGPGWFLKKSFFLHPVDLVDAFWHPPLWATSCSLP